jgi:hypothetical protein
MTAFSALRRTRRFTDTSVSPTTATLGELGGQVGGVYAVTSAVAVAIGLASRTHRTGDGAHPR